ncbi:MAG: DUF1385 domain-containing protein [Chloroflexota bacterium]|nr:DUF1385 domain-containing protein [Chloroflexota bacterium]
MAQTQETPRYGGRALRNGVMMVGPKAVAVAVRRPDGEIVTAVEPFEMMGMWAKGIPFIRGLVSMAGMLQLARISRKLEKKLNPQQSVQSVLPQLAPGIGAAIAERLTRELTKRTDERFVVPLETIAGIALPFVAFGISGQMPGVRELWRYHGAEHKAVNAAEAGLTLTPENAGGMSRVHPRCGTVFAFWGILGGALARAHVGSLPAGRRRTITGALSGPLILATAYEAVRLGAKYSKHPVGKALFGPAWQTQRLTTAEPDEGELAVAIAALQAVMEPQAASQAGEVTL